jgi:hypothetical protein
LAEVPDLLNDFSHHPVTSDFISTIPHLADALAESRLYHATDNYQTIFDFRLRDFQF